MELIEFKKQKRQKPMITSLLFCVYDDQTTATKGCRNAKKTPKLAERISAAQGHELRNLQYFTKEINFLHVD